MTVSPPHATTHPETRRVVLVTGASSGIGRAATIELARTGPALLLLVARRAAALAETIELAGERAAPDVELRALACDLGDAGQLDELVARIRSEVGRLDVLVNNAGTGTDLAFTDPDAMVDIDQMLALNLRAPIALVHGLLPLLAASTGVVVNVSSVAGLVGTPDSSVYSATKWGLTGFSEALRAFATPLGVRVTCVQPGPVPTPGWPHAFLASRPILGRVLASSTDVIARSIARAASGRGGPTPVHPRPYAMIPLLRGLAPWLVRRLLVESVRRNVSSTVTGLDRSGRIA